MGKITEQELFLAQLEICFTLDMNVSDGRAYLTSICDLTWARRRNHMDNTLTVTDDAERLIKAFAGPNGHAMVKLYQIKKGVPDGN